MALRSSQKKRRESKKHISKEREDCFPISPSSRHSDMALRGWVNSAENHACISRFGCVLSFFRADKNEERSFLCRSLWKYCAARAMPCVRTVFCCYLCLPSPEVVPRCGSTSAIG